MPKKKRLSIREATVSDSQLYYNWANDPVVRQMAFHTEPIPWDSHCKWFESKLNSDKSHLTLCYLGNTPVGQVRFDEVNNGEYEIDISIDGSYRGKGLGHEMLTSAIDFVHKKYHINIFVSEVKVENIPSQKMFIAVGFVLEKEENQVNYYKLNLEL